MMLGVRAGLCSNEIHEAVLHRSIPHLQAALKHCPTSIDEPNEVGHTPLHLASNWPPGLSLLLSHRADVEKTAQYGQKPVELAMLYGCAESMQLLLKAGCSFELNGDPEEINNIFTFAATLCRTPVSELPASTPCHNYLEIMRIVIKELASRQGEVISSMMDVPIPTRSKVSMSDNGQHFRSGTAQAGASDSSLREEAPQSQNILRHMRTVYHWPLLTVKVANELWNAGFRDIDVPDEYYMTPLMMIGGGDSFPPMDINEVIEIAFWLHQKGASLHRPWNARITAARSERRAIHFVAVAVKRCFMPQYFEGVTTAGEQSYPAAMEHLIDNLSPDCRQFLQKVLLDNSLDDCLCACSGHGCMPMTYLLKHTICFWPNENEAELASAWICRWFFENIPTEHLPTVTNQEILRLITFEKLGLGHTCCWLYLLFDIDTLEPEEVAEIRDEDHEGIELLESLLSEFEERRGDQDIKSFIDGYWSTRMEEVLAARDKESVDRTGMREIGVVFDDDDGSSDATVVTE